MTLKYNIILSLIALSVGASFVFGGLSTTLLIILLFFSIYNYKIIFLRNNINFALILIIVSYTLYPLSVLFSQIGRDVIVLNEYDSPIRFLFVVPLILFYINKNIKFNHYHLIILTLSLILSIIYDFYYIQSGISMYPGNRLSTLRFDPLLLSAYLSAFSLSFIFLIKKNIKFIFLLILTFLLLNTQSRTGITPFIILLPLVLFFYYKVYGLLLYLFILMSTLLGAYYFDQILFERLLNIINLLSNLGDLVSTKYEIRYIFAKVFSQIFIDNFNFGIGVKYNISNEFIHSIVGEKYNSSEFINGPHNQFLANAVNWGVLGLISSCLILVSNLYFFINKFYLTKNNFYLAGIVFNLSLIISCLSIEIFNIKSSVNIFIMLNLLLMKDFNENE
jgi:hypothetical protein